ncbi:MAG: hypothetical protein AAB874_00135, partial [Patescibacteria group bacterium]
VGTTVNNIVIDHSSISWGLDENINTWTDKVHDVTISWSITSEALYDSIHVDEGQPAGAYAPHSMGMLIGHDGKRISMHHNLIAHAADRTPWMQEGTTSEFVNNVIYNWGGGQWPAKYSGLGDIVLADTVNNFIKRGTNSTTTSRLSILLSSNLAVGSKVYVKGNMFYDQSHQFVGQDLVSDGSTSNSNYRSMTPAFGSGQIIVQTATQAYEDVLGSVGAIAPKRDGVDSYIVSSVRNGTGTIIDCIMTCNESSDRRNFHQGWPIYNTGVAPVDSDRDGIPNSWETTHGLNPNDANDGNQLAPSRYTWVEEYINSLI